VSFKKIQDLIPRAIDRSGDPEALLATQIISLWPLVTQAVMPEAALGKSRAKKLVAGQLTVIVSSHIWAQEYKLHFPELLRELNRQARRSAVRRIFFRVKS
jgi:Dna[CI] antecedent, DciA